MIRSPNDVIDVLKQLYITDKLGLQEQMIVLYLNRQNIVIGSSNMFQGAHSAMVLDLRIILGGALKLMASNIIISHNHPSGCLKPSKEDKALTSKLTQAAALLDIVLLDHLIVTPDFRFASVNEEDQ